jgi:NAD(P)H-dependent FMN reductase
MNILAFSTSNSKNSINRKLIDFAIGQLQSSSAKTVDINDYEMPIYGEDLEKRHGVPDAAKKFSREIEQADALLISLAEHNGSYTAAYKNLLDWLSRLDRNIFKNNKVVLLATSPGPGGASTVLRFASESMKFFEGDVVATFSLPNFYENYSEEEKKVVNEDSARALKEALKTIDR